MKALEDAFLGILKSRVDSAPEKQPLDGCSSWPPSSYHSLSWRKNEPCHRKVPLKKFIYLFSLCWVFVTLHGLSLVMASGGYIFTAVASLVVADFLVLAHRLSCLWHVESSQTRDWIRVPCVGRQILIHLTTREVLEEFLKKKKKKKTTFFFKQAKGKTFAISTLWNLALLVTELELWLEHL